jgi:preprotein translocase subunit YajC
MSLLIMALAYPAAIALLFYFAFYRPLQRERRRQRQTLQSLKVGDRVLTQGGLIATVKEVVVPEEGPTQVVLELAPGVEVTALATAIVQRLDTASVMATTEREDEAVA